MEEYEDFFGNQVAYFAIQQEHRNLTVTVSSEVEKTSDDKPDFGLFTAVPWEEVVPLARQSGSNWLEIIQYIPDTSFTEFTPQIKAYASESFRQGRSMYEATHHLMERIHKDFTYTPGFTTVSTPLSELMNTRKGVCQDFAHLAISCVRSMGLPARYISGYLETVAPPGKEKLTGADASHAWFDVYIPYIGWVAFDPTNNQLPATQHITACWGRDYADIAPLKGVIINSGPHQLQVAVNVKRLG